MAKYTNIGFIAKRKDGKGTYIKIDQDVKLTKGMFLNLNKKPTDEEVENNPKLAGMQEKWPDWVVAKISMSSPE